MNTIKHDGQILHPLGGASYVYEQDIIRYLASRLTRKNIRISIGAQPNGSPHFGTLAVFSLAFALAELLNKQNSKTTSITFEVIDTAPAKELVIDGLRYQISLRNSGQADIYLAQYKQLLNILKGLTGVDFILRRQEAFNSQQTIPDIIREVVENKVLLAPILDPKKKKLKIRVPCPDCGLTDKDSVRNILFKNYLQAYCPKHGKFRAYYKNSNRFEYNTPLRNLIRALVYSADNTNPKKDYCWVRITGADYAGFYQEELLYRTVALMGYGIDKLPIILYAPLIVDWSGAKLSKSMYVKHGAYKYLPDYLVSYERFHERFGEKGIAKLHCEVKSWLENPYKLFRTYSVYYFMEVFGYE
ncbi:MAG: hypothetical protein ABIB98_02600 [bacterium]